MRIITYGCAAVGAWLIAMLAVIVIVYGIRCALYDEETARRGSGSYGFAVQNEMRRMEILAAVKTFQQRNQPPPGMVLTLDINVQEKFITFGWRRRPTIVWDWIHEIFYRRKHVSDWYVDSLVTYLIAQEHLAPVKPVPGEAAPFPHRAGTSDNHDFRKSR